MTKNRTPTPVYLDPGMHPGLEVKALTNYLALINYLAGQGSMTKLNLNLQKEYSFWPNTRTSNTAV